MELDHAHDFTYDILRLSIRIFMLFLFEDVGKCDGMDRLT